MNKTTSPSRKERARQKQALALQNLIKVEQRRRKWLELRGRRRHRSKSYQKINHQAPKEQILQLKIQVHHSFHTRMSVNRWHQHQRKQFTRVWVKRVTLSTTRRIKPMKYQNSPIACSEVIKAHILNPTPHRSMAHSDLAQQQLVPSFQP